MHYKHETNSLLHKSFGISKSSRSADDCWGLFFLFTTQGSQRSALPWQLILLQQPGGNAVCSNAGPRAINLCLVNHAIHNQNYPKLCEFFCEKGYSWLTVSAYTLYEPAVTEHNQLRTWQYFNSQAKEKKKGGWVWYTDPFLHHTAGSQITKSMPSGWSELSDRQC